MPGPRCRFMAKSKPGWWSSPPETLRYAVAVVSVASALASALWLQDHLVGAPVPLFLCAVMLSAWFGGLRAGLLASALSLLAFDYYFVAPIDSLAVDIEELPRLVLVAASILFVCLLTATQHSTTELLGRARDDLDGTVRELKRINEALRETEQRFRDYAETASDLALGDRLGPQIPAHLGSHQDGRPRRHRGAWSKAVGRRGRCRGGTGEVARSHRRSRGASAISRLRIQIDSSG